MFAELLIVIPALLQARGYFLMNTQVLDPEQPESTFQFGPEDFEYEENPTELKDMAIIRMLRKRNKGMIRMLRKRNTAGQWRMKKGSLDKGRIRILKRNDIGNKNVTAS